jgi:hypothetical protein
MKRTTKKRKYTRNIRKKGKRTRRYKKHTRRYKKHTRRYKKKGGVVTRRAAASTAVQKKINPKFKGVSSVWDLTRSEEEEEKYNITSKIHPPNIVYPNFPTEEFKLGDLEALHENDALQNKALQLWRKATLQSDTDENRKEWEDEKNPDKEKWLVQALVGEPGDDFKHRDSYNKKIDYTRKARKACKQTCYLNNRFCDKVILSNNSNPEAHCGKCFLGFKPKESEEEEEEEEEDTTQPCYRIARKLKPILKK